MVKIGIDLGTTNSLVTYWSNEGAMVIPNALGNNSTPSIVSIDDNQEILVGEVAKERLITYPNLTAGNFKRHMGTNRVYKLGQFEFSPTELSSFVLRALKEDAEAYLGEKINKAIISVPAYFNDTQRKATKRAAELAGLKVERLISEPTAGAVAYGLDNVEGDSMFLVFDLGGGTFDISILELFDGIMQVRSVAGDNQLGGEDFTRTIYNYFIQHNDIDIKLLDKKKVSMLKKKAEECKQGLTYNEEWTIDIDLKGRQYSTTITKTLFEKLCSGLIQRLIYPMTRAIKDADITIDDLDAVILIGGATRMPIIKSTVSKMFRKYPCSNINPDETVSLGAAIQAGLKNRDAGLKEIILTDVCPYTLGTSIIRSKDDGYIQDVVFSPIIERNSPIPISKVSRYCTVYDNQEQIKISIYQGESRNVSNNILLGEVEIEIPKNYAGREAIDTRFTYDINGILEVQVTSLSTKETKSIVINNYDNDISESELLRRKKILAKLKIHPRNRQENRLLIEKGNRLYEEALGELREYIGLCMGEFEDALSTQNEKIIIEATEVFKQKLERINDYRERL
jgi:molecular chaperone HscC